MRHKAYMLHLDMITRMVRKSGRIDISKKDTSEKALQKAATYLYKEEPRMMHTLDFMVDSEEHFWLTHGKHTYFFDSSETARALIDSSYSIEDLSAVYSGMESFMLCLPDDLMLGGQKVTGGVLVNLSLHSERGDHMINHFSKWIDKPAPNVEYDSDKTNAGLYCCYQQDYGSFEYMRLAMPLDNIGLSLKFKSAEEYGEYMASTNKFNYFAGADLDAPEQAFQFDLIRLIAGLLLYKKAMPERFKQGMPFSFKEQNYDSRYIKNHKPQILHSPATAAKESIHSAHYRSWHFRQLMNERYYHGEHEHKPKGSRIVFVKDSMVSREVEAETVT